MGIAPPFRPLKGFSSLVALDALSRLKTNVMRNSMIASDERHARHGMSGIRDRTTTYHVAKVSRTYLVEL